ncbi:hypothetical protein M407DRAFT_28663 [Tulasnella calospora MUT 4182]|uniref:Protein kinase domain-containing protein n=1 Tax=Tulasnella calospora MUT 4182 TaxID=1051891 RepID=A0A0C3QBM7_9AGAM|nr:hypothetical protein M407DRAFT_28663 [Tulasnella calospora MUT 4182]
MAGLSHGNIIRLIGFVEDLGKETAWIVLPWEPNGNVGEFLATGHWEIPERIALDKFKGFRYLHTRRPPICHSDLKSLNILVTSSFRAVITDFGSARKIREPEGEVAGDESGPQAQGVPTTVQACPPIHVAPEFMYGKRPGLSSDVWAAGWVCWEVMTDKVPFPELNSAGVITLTFDDGLLFDPKARPKIARCCEELQWMPSTPPSGGNSPGSKATSIELLLRNGDISYNQQNYKNAGSLFQQALALAESAGNRKAAADALRWLGAIYRHQSKFIRVNESYSRGQEMYARIGDSRGRANTLNGLGEVYRLQSKYAETEESYSRAHEIFTRIGYNQARANALRLLGNVYRAQSKYTEAEESYILAQEIYARIGHDLGRADTLRDIGRLRRDQGRNAEAAAHHMDARDLYTKIGMIRNAEKTSRLLAVVLPDHNSTGISPQTSVHPNIPSTNLPR